MLPSSSGVGWVRAICARLGEKVMVVVVETPTGKVADETKRRKKPNEGVITRDPRKCKSVIARL